MDHLRQASGFMGSLDRQVAAMNVESGIGSESGAFSALGAATATQESTFSNADAASVVKTEHASVYTSSGAAAAAGGSEIYPSSSSAISKQQDRPKPKKITLRKGKWTDEEELFTKKLIDYFNQGLLNVATGTTLRTYLSEKLWWYVSLSTNSPPFEESL
jgi:hypothetical protein